MTASKTVAAPKAEAPAIAVKAKPAQFAESATITLVAEKNPKRGASAKRFAAYKTGLTVGAYLDACLALQPDEPRYRWRADLAWDVKHGFITIA